MSLKSWTSGWSIAAIAAVLGASPAYAANYACSGPVNGVTVGPSGTVSAESAGGQRWGHFCVLGTSTNNISAEACKGILGVLLAAQASGKHVQIWYSDDYDCNWHASNGAWQYLDTWYWGPSLLN